MELDQKEAKERLDELKRKALVGKGEMTMRDLDGLEVGNPKPGKKYRWINAKGMNVDRQGIKGWEICKDADVKAGILANGTHKNGDLVLAEMSEEQFKKLAAKSKDRAERMERAIESGFHEEGRKLGLKTFEEIDGR